MYLSDDADDNDTEWQLDFSHVSLLMSILIPMFFVTLLVMICLIWRIPQYFLYKRKSEGAEKVKASRKSTNGGNDSAIKERSSMSTNGGKDSAKKERSSKKIPYSKSVRMKRGVKSTSKMPSPYRNGKEIPESDSDTIFESTNGGKDSAKKERSSVSTNGGKDSAKKERSSMSTNGGKDSAKKERSSKKMPYSKSVRMKSGVKSTTRMPSPYRNGKEIPESDSDTILELERYHDSPSP